MNPQPPDQEAVDQGARHPSGPAATTALFDEVRPAIDAAFAGLDGPWEASWVEGNIVVVHEHAGLRRMVHFRRVENRWEVTAFAYRRGWIARHQTAIRLVPMVTVGVLALLTPSWHWAPFALLGILVGWVPVFYLAKRDLIDDEGAVATMTERLQSALAVLTPDTKTVGAPPAD